jgi:hypothetical protein
MASLQSSWVSADCEEVRPFVKGQYDAVFRHLTRAGAAQFVALAKT